MYELSFWIGVLGTVAFAVTAVLAVAPKSIDLFGVSVLATITAIGGGTLRDVILDVPVFWTIDVSYIWIALGATVVAFYAKSLFTLKWINKSMLYLDAAGIAFFSIQAVGKVWNLGFGLPIAPVMLGVMTAIGGGLVRDVLTGRENLLMSKELYAIPVLIGCVLYAFVLEYFPEFRAVGSICSVIFIFVARTLAIEKNLTVPAWLISNGGRGN